MSGQGSMSVAKLGRISWGARVLVGYRSRRIESLRVGELAEIYRSPMPVCAGYHSFGDLKRLLSTHFGEDYWLVRRLSARALRS